MGMKIVNVDRLHSAVFGGSPSEHDQAIVYSTTENEPHLITGELQPKVLFRGTLKEAHAFCTFPACKCRPHNSCTPSTRKAAQERTEQR